MTETESELQRFLSNPRNSVTREKLLYHRLYYDLKIGAAEAGYHLTLFEPDVDRDGYDVVIDDGEATQFVQLKTLLRTSKTSVWGVKRKLLGYNEPDDFGYQSPDLRKAGFVLLIEMDAEKPVPTFRYYLTDIEIIRMISQLFGQRKRNGKPYLLKTRRDIALRTLHDIETGRAQDKCFLPKSAFLRMRDPSALLAMLGLYSKYEILHPTYQFQTLQSNGMAFDSAGSFTGEPCVGREGAALATSILEILDEPLLCANPTLDPDDRQS